MTTFVESIITFFTVKGSGFKNIVVALIQIVLIILLAILLRVIADKAAERIINLRLKNKPVRDKRKIKTVVTLTKSIIRFLIGFLACVAVLSVIGLKNTVISIITTAGVGGIAVGIGARSLISDTINGFFILLDDAYAVGDLVKIKDYRGRVEEINIRATKLLLEDNSRVTIPNGGISDVINYSRNLYNEYVDFVLPITSDSREAEEVIVSSAEDYISEKGLFPAEAKYVGTVSSTEAVKTLRLQLCVEDSQRSRHAREIRERTIEKLLEEGLYKKL